MSSEETIMSSKDMKKKLCAELQVKVEREYADYIDSLYHMLVEDVVKKSYKTVVMRECKGVLGSNVMESLELEKLEQIIQIDNLLEKLYNRWRVCDSDETDLYKEFVFKNWEFLIQDLELSL